MQMITMMALKPSAIPSCFTAFKGCEGTEVDLLGHVSFQDAATAVAQQEERSKRHEPNGDGVKGALLQEAVLALTIF